MRDSEEISISTARFANVAFSDGSLLHGFNERIKKRQPIVAPNDVKRYFLTSQESGELCLMSCIFGENRDIFFPKLSESLHLITFSDIAIQFLRSIGYEPYSCSSEEEAREKISSLPDEGSWPVLFTSSDTTGEKDFEEFYTNKEILDLNRFENIGIILNDPIYNSNLLSYFEEEISCMKSQVQWSKLQIIDLFSRMIPEFSYEDKKRYLDEKM